MRIVLALAAALLLLAGIAGEAGAATYAKKHERYAKKSVAGPEYRDASSTRPDAFVERNADKLPFGSAIWWDQMQREGRLGGEVP